MSSLENVLDECDLDHRYLKKFEEKQITIENLFDIDKSILRRVIKKKEERKKLTNWIENKRKRKSSKNSLFSRKSSNYSKKSQKNRKIAKSLKNPKKEEKSKSSAKNQKSKNSPKNEESKGLTMDDGLRKFSKLLTLSNRRSTIQFDQNLKANKTSSSKNKDSPELENLFKRRKNIKRKKEILDNKDLDNDYIDILAKFMSSSEHRTNPKIVTIDRKIFKKVPKKEDENIDNLIELLTEKFQKADFKDEKLEKPQILDQAD
ncbi:hypothetical protein MHBO_003925, partial [Bonamia ostreae]